MYRAMLLGALISGLTVAPTVMAAHHSEEFHAVFSGFNEVGGLNAQTGAILSDGQAILELRLNRADQTLSFVLRYSGLSAAVTQAHIHFGKIHMAGGVMVFFCSNLAGAPPGTQPCPANGGTVTGTLSAANVLGPAAQGVAAGDFQAIVDALESNTTYANIHTTAFPAGEIRGEIRRGFSFGLHDE
jgi:CHRD domain